MYYFILTYKSITCNLGILIEAEGGRDLKRAGIDYKRSIG
jgi:hypothetical protein